MTFLAVAELTYGAREFLNKLSEEDQEYFKTRFHVWKDGFYGKEHVDEADLEWLTERRIEVTLSKVKGLNSQGKLGEKLNQYITQVHVPNVGLLAISHVELLEDCCTDELSNMLKIGWRIIAVCPPNSQRRPDYIVGYAGEPPK